LRGGLAAVVLVVEGKTNDTCYTAPSYSNTDEALYRQESPLHELASTVHRVNKKTDLAYRQVLQIGGHGQTIFPSELILHQTIPI
jgi:1,6-anhydro-N-acetylmuramate kinase